MYFLTISAVNQFYSWKQNSGRVEFEIRARGQTNLIRRRPTIRSSTQKATGCSILENKPCTATSAARLLW